MQIRRLLSHCLLIHSVLFILSIHPAYAFSQLYIFHINGVNTQRNEAYENLRGLQENSRIRYHSAHWELLYNETHGLLKSDLIDVLRQKNQEHEQLDIYDYADAYMQAHHLSYPWYSSEYRNLLDNIKDYYAKDLDFVGLNFADILKQYHEVMRRAATSIATYMRSQPHDKHPIVLFIGHSQGCLYANSIIQYIIEAEKFPAEFVGLYAFASPAAKLAYSTQDESLPVIGNHLTADNDYVIKAVSGLSYILPVTDRPLSSNIHLNICQDGGLCHGLINAYLVNADAIRQFYTDVNRVSGHLIALGNL